MIDQLIINENAYFYKVIKPITSSMVDTTFASIKKDKKSDEIAFEENRTHVEGRYYRSSLIFGFETPPNFLDAEKTSLVEKKYGYIILLEIGDLLIVNRKNAPGISCIFNFVEELDYSIIARLYVTNSTLFEKFHMQNMDFSNAALRSKTMEANNLQESMPLLSTQRYIIRSLRLYDKQIRYALSLSTSRITKIGNKRNLTEFVSWVENVIAKISDYKLSPSFLDAFPDPIDYQDEIKKCTPIGILFLLDRLFLDIEEGKLNSIKYQIKDDKLIDIPMQTFLSGLEHFKNHLTISDVTKRAVVKKYSIQNTIDDTLQLAINQKSIKLRSKKMNKIKLCFEDNEDGYPLIDYVNQKQMYFVNFNKPDLIYYSHKLFKDKNIINNIDGLLNVFDGYLELNGVASEKGTFTDASVEFEGGSIFHFIITKLCNNYKFCVCDDLGDEWADIIGIDDAGIHFFHAKYKDDSLSAAALSDVIAQAQKNIGRYLSSNKDWDQKIRKWKEKYNNDNANTQINRLLIGSSVEDFIDDVERISISPNKDKIVYIVIKSLSKKDVTDAFRSLKEKPDDKHPAYIIQLLWLTTSVVSTCVELGVKIKIICRP